MTETMKNAIIKRWNRIANADLGSYIESPATKIAQFFEDAFSNEIAGQYIVNRPEIPTFLTGFSYFMNDPQEFNYTSCLDLDTCTMTSYGLQELDSWLMDQEPYSGAGRNFEAIYMNEI